jgi:hypothetical protein
MRMKAVQSLEESRTSCQMTHYCFPEDFLLEVVLQSDSGLDSLELLQYFVLMVGAAATVMVVVVVVVVGFPYTFPPDMSSILTPKLISRWVFALVEVSRFLTVGLFLKLLHILMCRKYFYYCLKI